jgi:hypothetical protein
MPRARSRVPLLCPALLWPISDQSHVFSMRVCVVAHFGALAHGVVLFARQTTNSPGLVTAELAQVGRVGGRHPTSVCIAV